MSTAGKATNIVEALDGARAALEGGQGARGRNGVSVVPLGLDEAYPAWVFPVVSTSPTDVARQLGIMGMGIDAVSERAGVLRFDLTDRNDGGPDRALDGRVGYLEVPTSPSSRGAGLGVLRWETRPEVP